VTRAGRFLTLASLLACLTLGGCRHVLRTPGGDIRIGVDPEPVGPVITPESRSGAACGPELPACPGGTQCFATGASPTCLTEEAACAEAGCADRLCQILESFPLKAVCY
jgi:hypothetical protein